MGDKKRTNNISWEEYFMSLALVAAKRSEDPKTQAGACIVNERKIIVSIGYDKFLVKVGCDYFSHAEMNAIVNKNSADIKGCTIYMSHFPCNNCAKMIVQSEIKKVVYLLDKDAEKPETIASKKMFREAGVEFVGYKENNKQICIKIYRNDTQNSDDHISCEEYFMSLAELAAQRSKDPETQVGACIVNKEKVIVGIGYNGFPILPPREPPINNDDIFSWIRRKQSQKQDRIDNKHMYVCHAEMNAIMLKNSTDVKGCTIYVSLVPCIDCAKLIIQSGITKVVFFSDKYAAKSEYIQSKKMLQNANITCERFGERVVSEVKVMCKAVEIDILKFYSKSDDSEVGSPVSVELFHLDNSAPPEEKKRKIKDK